MDHPKCIVSNQRGKYINIQRVLLLIYKCDFVTSHLRVSTTQDKFTLMHILTKAFANIFARSGAYSPEPLISKMCDILLHFSRFVRGNQDIWLL